VFRTRAIPSGFATGQKPFANLVGVVPGREHSKTPLLIGAHYGQLSDTPARPPFPSWVLKRVPFFIFQSIWITLAESHWIFCFLPGNSIGGSAGGVARDVSAGLKVA